MDIKLYNFSLKYIYILLQEILITIQGSSLIFFLLAKQSCNVIW